MENNYKVLIALMGLDIGGAETHVLELCKALRKRGLDLYVVSNGGAYEQELLEAGVKHYNVPLNNKRLRSLIASYLLLKTIIKENNIRLVHAHARIPAFLCGLLQKRLGFRFVTTTHFPFNTALPYRLLTNWGEASLAVADDLKTYLTENYRVPAENILLTVNGIDIDKFKKGADARAVANEFSLDKNKRRVVMVARMDATNNMAAYQLIEGAARLAAHNENIEIIIVGGGNDLENVKQKAEAANKTLGKRVVLAVGNRTDVPLFLELADVFVGLSRAALEAMAFEKPAILAGDQGYMGIFDASKLDDAIDTNFCCRGFALPTTEKLTTDIMTLLDMDADARVRLGQFGREVVARHYSIGRMTDDALALYAKVNNGGRPIDVMISGYYGFNNNGDDAMLKAIVDSLKTLRPNINILVLSKQPRETQENLSVLAINRFNFFLIAKRLKQTELLISGGGSLIQDLTSAHSLLYYLWVINAAIRAKAKVMLYANGIGPVRRDSSKWLIQKVLNKVDLITLRDEHSLEVLQALRVSKPKTLVTVDAAFALRNTDEQAASRRLQALGLPKNTNYFCIAVRSWKYSHDRFEPEIADFADYVAQTYGLTPIFIAMQPLPDGVISNKILGLMQSGGVFLGSDYSTNELLGIIEKAKFIVGMRLHTIVYAMKAGTPVIGLVYDPKVKSMMDAIAQPTYAPVENVDSAQLKAYADTVIQNHAAIRAEILLKTADFREKSTQNATLAESLMNV